MNNLKNNLKTLLFGFVIGFFLTGAGGVVLYKNREAIRSGQFSIKKAFSSVKNIKIQNPIRKIITEDFKEPIAAISGKSFGKEGQLTFELFRNGTFMIDGKTGYALQRSENYRDSAFIRSTQALPNTYKVRAVVGGIDYGLERISGLAQDPEYPEGPQNENGCYLLSIVDEPPTGHHTNIWWHQHRKVVIDVDNNVWGHGMPYPIFMVYFDKTNRLFSFDGKSNDWTKQWTSAVTYDPQAWYNIEIERTKTQYHMSISDEKGRLLKQGSIDLNEVWNADENYPDYFVIGDPHENYYQGEFKIREISIEY